MKETITRPAEIEVTHVKVSIPADDEEDFPPGMPLVENGRWVATINIDTGTIEDWPQGSSWSLFSKVRDSGIYILLNKNVPHESLQYVAQIHQDYVPNYLIPGEYGDYIDLKIDPSGKILNWPKSPSIRDFFPTE